MDGIVNGRRVHERFLVEKGGKQIVGQIVVRVDVLEAAAAFRVVHGEFVAQIVEQATDLANQQTGSVGERPRVPVSAARFPGNVPGQRSIAVANQQQKQARQANRIAKGERRLVPRLGRSQHGMVQLGVFQGFHDKIPRHVRATQSEVVLERRLDEKPRIKDAERDGTGIAAARRAVAKAVDGAVVEFQAEGSVVDGPVQKVVEEAPAHGDGKIVRESAVHLLHGSQETRVGETLDGQVGRRQHHPSGGIFFFFIAVVVV